MVGEEERTRGEAAILPLSGRAEAHSSGFAPSPVLSPAPNLGATLGQHQILRLAG